MSRSAAHRIAIRTSAVAASLLLSIGIAALPAAADHAAEKVTVSKTTDLTDGETVKVTFSGFDPAGKPAKVVIAGQGQLVTIPDKLNFDEYAVAPSTQVGPDGTGSFDFVVTSDHGTVQDGSTLNCLVQQCWIIVVQEPFLPQPNYNSVAISFVGGIGAPTTVAPPTTAAPGAVTTPPTTAAPTTAAPTTVETTTTTTTVRKVVVVKKTKVEEGGSGALYAIIAGVIVVLGAGAYVITKRKPEAG